MEVFKMVKLLVGIIVGLSLTISAHADEWRMLTDKRSVRDLLYMDNKLWIASSGGLSEFDTERKTFSSWSLIDNLAGVGIQQLAPDGADAFWIAYDNRMLQRFECDGGVTHTVAQLSQESEISSLNDIAINNHGIFVATSRGVALLNYHEHITGYRVKTDYTQLGSFTTKQSVNAVGLQGDKLWVGTDIGVACGDLDSPDPLTWLNYTVDDGLSGNRVRDLIIFEDKVVIATDGGVSTWDGARWSTISQRRDLKHFILSGDTLRAYFTNGYVTWNGSDWEETSSNGITSLVLDEQGNIWTGTTNNGNTAGGVSTLSDTGWVNYLPDGPNTNSVLCFEFATNGDLLIGGGRSGGEFGLSRYIGDHWQTWTAPQYQNNFFTKQTVSIAIDHEEGIWAGSFGGGIARFNPDETITYYDGSPETGAKLAFSGEVGVLTWTITPAVATDPDGNIWVVNHSAEDGNTLVCIPNDFISSPSPEKDWYYFHRSLFNNFPYFERIAIDDRGRIWLASNANSTSVQSIIGVYVLDPNGTPDDPSDDKVWKNLSGMNSGQVNSLVWDPAGYIWAGAIDGAYYIETDRSDLDGLSFTQLYPLRDVQVNAITIDSRGNRWFGTNFGVTVLDVDLFTVRRSITTNYPDFLPAETVRAISIDPQTGWSYIATDAGTAALLTPYRDYGQSISSVTIEPNPFNPNRGVMYFTGSSLAKSASVKILTPDGRLVRNMSNNDAALGWDGRDNNGKSVADGVYLILAYNDEGQAAQGKVAVIWK